MSTFAFHHDPGQLKVRVVVERIQVSSDGTHTAVVNAGIVTAIENELNKSERSRCVVVVAEEVQESMCSLFSPVIDINCRGCGYGFPADGNGQKAYDLTLADMEAVNPVFSPTGNECPESTRH